MSSNKEKTRKATHFNELGIGKYRENFLQEAAIAFRKAIELNPKDPEIHNNLGIVLAELNYIEEAIISFCRAVTLKSDYADGYRNLGMALKNKNSLGEAAACLQRAIELNPYDFNAYNILGVIQAQENFFNEATICFHRAIDLEPNFSEAYGNLGMAYKNMNCLAEAEYYLRQGIERQDNYVESYNDLGILLAESNRIEEAEECFKISIKLNPTFFETYYYQGVFYKFIKKLDQAERALKRAIALQKNFSKAYFSLGFLYLLQERYDIGWKYYESRSSLRENPLCRWQGEDLSGCRILLFHEQGFGDTMQFFRYVLMIAQSASQVVLAVPKELEKLLMISSPPNCIITIDENILPEQYEFTCPLPSLPYVFHTSQQTIPNSIPYIQASNEAIGKWRDILANTTVVNGCKIGIAWAGNPLHKNDRNRSIPFAIFSKLLMIPTVTWINLQVGSHIKDISETFLHVLDFTEKMTDFFETAGLIANLDLVITVDTSIAHLAGAMGKKTWLLLPFSPDWRWQLDRTDSPWYPTMQLFRQQKIGDWSEVLTQVKAELSKISQEGQLPS